MQTTVNSLCFENESRYRILYLQAQILEKRDYRGEDEVPMSPLNNFSDFFSKTKEVFMTLEEVTQLDLQSNLKNEKYRKN